MEYRKKLVPFLNERHNFRGVFDKYGIKNTYVGKKLVTILMLNISFTDKPDDILTDHLWFNLTKGFEALKLRNGDIVEFNGTISTYPKGYSEDDEENPFREDYNLKFPRKVIRIGNINNKPDVDKYNAEILLKVAEHNQERHERIVKYHEELDKDQQDIKNSISQPKKEFDLAFKSEEMKTDIKTEIKQKTLMDFIK